MVAAVAAVAVVVVVAVAFPTKDLVHRSHVEGASQVVGMHNLVMETCVEGEL